MENPADLDDERYVTQRARLLARQTGLRKVEAKAVAYSELSYSRGGMAREMGTNKSTVKSYHEKAMALYGFKMLEYHAKPDEEPPEYDRGEAGYHRQRTPVDQKKWVNMIDRHRERLPQEWVNDVLESAAEDAVRPDLD